MKRRLLAAGALVLVLALGVVIGLVVAPESSSEEVSAGPVDTSHCEADPASPAAGAPVEAPTTAPLEGFVYDQDGPGPVLPQEPIDGYDPLDPTAPPPGAPGTEPGSVEEPSGTVLTYDPSGTQGGDTYTVFADLVEAASTVRGGGTIFVPNDAVIDAPGEYDLNYFGFASNGSTRGFTRTILTIPDGVTFTNPGYLLAQGALILYSTSSSPVVTHTAESYETSRMFILENDGLIASQRAPLFEFTAVSNTSFIFISLRQGGGIAKPSDLGIPGGDHESILANPGAGAVVIADVAPPLNFYDGTVRGEGNIAWMRYTTAIPYQGTSYARGRSQPNAAAFGEFILSTTALSVHEQADPDNWINVDGSTTASSLDELACRVQALEAALDQGN